MNKKLIKIDYKILPLKQLRETTGKIVKLDKELSEAKKKYNIALENEKKPKEKKKKKVVNE